MYPTSTTEIWPSHKLKLFHTVSAFDGDPLVETSNSELSPASEAADS